MGLLMRANRSQGPKKKRHVSVGLRWVCCSTPIVHPYESRDSRRPGPSWAVRPCSGVPCLQDARSLTAGIKGRPFPTRLQKKSCSLRTQINQNALGLFRPQKRFGWPKRWGIRLRGGRWRGSTACRRNSQRDWGEPFNRTALAFLRPRLQSGSCSRKLFVILTEFPGNPDS